MPKKIGEKGKMKSDPIDMNLVYKRKYSYGMSRVAGITACQTRGPSRLDDIAVCST